MTIVPARRPEQLLLDLLPELAPRRLLCNTVGRAQFAAQFAALHPSTGATCWFLDQYQLEQARAVQPPLANLHLVCAADPPAEPYELVVWSFSRQGEGELVREMLQTWHERLVPGGLLVASIDYPKDQWLHELLQRLFEKVTRRQFETGVVYFATRQSPLRKLKNYAAEFAFRDGPHLIHLRTRPGVFSHRELDGGARALLKSMTVEPNARVLDLGCGSGAVGLAAALREPSCQVTAIDSSARAIEATLWAQARNNAPNLVASLDCDGRTIEPAAYSLVVANPPYYSDFRIAELFVKTAAKALQPTGLLLVVTKSPSWYFDRLEPTFRNLTSREVGHYTVLSAEKS